MPLQDRATDRVLSAVLRRRVGLVQFTQSLIRIPTVNPPGQDYVKIVSLLERKARDLSLKIRRIEVPMSVRRKFGAQEGDRRINLLCTWDVGARKTLHVNGHYDVVPVTSGWTLDPFGALIKSGCVVGRGAEDMKADVASMLFAVEVLKSCSLKPPVNLEFSFTPDEETGGQTGLGYLVKKGLIHPDIALGEGISGGFVSIGNKGMLWMELEILGRAAHGSLPQKGVNALEQALPLMTRLFALKEKVQRRKTRHPVRNAQEAFATMVVGGDLRGGEKVNTVPDRVRVSIDRRLIPEESLAQAQREIFSVVAAARKDNPKLKVRVRTLACEPPVVVSPAEPICQAVVWAVTAARGRRPRLCVMPGGTDMRFLIRRGIPACGYGAQGQERYHADDEAVPISSIVESCQVFALTPLAL